MNQICLAGCLSTHRHTLHWHTCLSLLTFCTQAELLVLHVVYNEWFQTAQRAGIKGPCSVICSHEIKIFVHFPPLVSQAVERNAVCL